MRETLDDLSRLQRLLDDSIQSAGAVLRRSLQMPQQSLTANELVGRLEGALTVALATVTARGEPRVAPVSAIFLHARFYVPTLTEAARARHLAARPSVSLTYFDGEEFAVIAHGRATLIDPGRLPFDEIDSLHVACGNESIRHWQGSAVYLEIDPARLFTFARNFR